MLKEKNKFIATLLAFAVIPMSGLATDIYLPSMPSMALELQQPETKIQLTLTLFLISYGVTQIFAGSVVDSFGRYRVTLVSLGLFMVSFLVTALTKDIMVIYAMRVLQGILAGFAVVAKRVFFLCFRRRKKETLFERHDHRLVGRSYYRPFYWWLSAETFRMAI